MAATALLGMNPSVLFAGLIGALAVFFLGILKEWWHRRRECHGLLRILFAEVRENQRSVDFLLLFFNAGRQNEVLPIVEKGHMRRDAWKDVRVKLAADLSGKEFAVLAAYYRDLQAFEEFSGDEIRDPTALAGSRASLRRLAELGQKAEEVIRKRVLDVSEEQPTEEDLDRLGFLRLTPG